MCGEQKYGPFHTNDFEPEKPKTSKEWDNNCGRQYGERKMLNGPTFLDSVGRRMREYQYQATIRYQSKLLHTYRKRQVELENRNNALENIFNAL